MIKPHVTEVVTCYRKTEKASFDVNVIFTGLINDILYFESEMWACKIFEPGFVNMCQTTLPSTHNTFHFRCLFQKYS